MSLLVNTFGRPFDDLDALKMHLAARDLASRAEFASYSVVESPRLI